MIDLLIAHLVGAIIEVQFGTIAVDLGGFVKGVVPDLLGSVFMGAVTVLVVAVGLATSVYQVNALDCAGAATDATGIAVAAGEVVFL